MHSFRLIAGIEIPDISAASEGFIAADSGLVCSVSAENLEPLAIFAVKTFKKPLFFFLELPCTEDEERVLGGGMHKNVYYLDNCTEAVCLAIIKRYRELIFADGLCEYGFGTADGEEIYFRRYQNVSILANDKAPFVGKLTKMGIKNKDAADVNFLGDIISPQNPGTLTAVEVDGEDIYTMLANLKQAGMYFSHTADDS